MTRTNDYLLKRIERLIIPVLDELAFELVAIDYLFGGGKSILRIYIDKAGGITIDDCVQASREIGDLIYVKDVIPHNYVLEVSSPGLDRPLKSKREFFWARGKKVKIKMISPIDGRKSFTGLLQDFRDETLYLEGESGLVLLPWRDVEKASLMYDFKE